MKVTVLIESIIIPRKEGRLQVNLPPDASAADLVGKLAEEGLTGTLTAEDVLRTHTMIRSSAHITPETVLKDGDTILLIKTLLGG